jgi:ubiquinone/menaquinone biosynthesis C-methylase UbiE
MRRTHQHFSIIAHKYKDLRTTDLGPVLLIKERLRNLAKITAGDLGCGVGRYDLELFRQLDARLHLICIDDNENMLTELTMNLEDHKIGNFQVVRARVDGLPLPASSLDCVITFNAVHHFKLFNFLKEASRALRKDGYLFVYTRLRSQNKRNIWGRYFPKFYEKEKRLYELDELKGALKETPSLRLESIEYFKYKRVANLEWLITQARNRHYSTFYLYDEEEFEESLKKFQEEIAHRFKDPGRIVWYDENTMLVIRKGGGNDARVSEAVMRWARRTCEDWQQPRRRERRAARVEV